MKSIIVEKLKKINIIYIILFSICLVAIIPILHLAIYSRPCVDDYAYSVQTHKLISSGNYNIFEIIKEAIKTDINYYNNWQGLYSSAFILALQPGIFGEQYYFIGAWLLMALMFGCLYFFAKTILIDILKLRKYALLITMAALSIIIAELPSIVEGLYWFNGAWNYMPFFFLTLINITFLLRYLYLDKKENIIYSVVLSLIISGGNHITSVLNIGLLIIFNILTIKKQRLSLIPLICAIIGFIIMYIAPGTSIRQEQLPSQGIIDTLLASKERTFDFFIYWCDITWILTIIMLIPVSYYIKKEKIIKKDDLKFNPIILFITKVIIIFILHCVPYKAMGNFGQGRVTNVIWLTHILLSSVCWIYFIIWTSFRIKNLSKYKWIAAALLPIIFIGIIFGRNSNIVKAIENIKNGEAQEFAYCCDLRYEKMNETKENIMYIEPLPHNKMLRFDDVSSNIEDWKNKVWKDYYGKDIIVRSNSY